MYLKQTSQLKTLLLRVFEEEGPINPYEALSYLNKVPGCPEITNTRFLEAFWDLYHQGCLRKLSQTTFVPSTHEERKRWHFSEVLTFLYELNGEECK